MPDDSPVPRNRRQRLIAPMLLGSIVVAVIIAPLLWRELRPHSSSPPQPGVEATGTPQPAPIAPPVLSRADLILLGGEFASSSAAGEPLAAPGSLGGRAFLIRLPFGCEGPTMPSNTVQASYAFDARTKTYRLTARPQVWTGSPLIGEAAGQEKVEAVEGFWIPRPWILSEGCPASVGSPAPSPDVATPAGDKAVAPAPDVSATTRTLGLAQIFSADASRVRRRAGRPYEFVLKAAGDRPTPTRRPFWIVIEGRVAAFGDGQAFHCISEAMDQRPVCLLAVEIDKVSFVDPADNEVLAEWRD